MSFSYPTPLFSYVPGLNYNKNTSSIIELSTRSLSIGPVSSLNSVSNQAGGMFAHFSPLCADYVNVLAGPVWPSSEGSGLNMTQHRTCISCRQQNISKNSHKLFTFRIV